MARVLVLLVPVGALFGNVERCDYGDVVEKRTYRPRERILYLAGLEHTGHHLWAKGILRQFEAKDAGLAYATSRSLIRREERYDGSCELRGMDEVNLGRPSGESRYKRQALPPWSTKDGRKWSIFNDTVYAVLKDVGNLRAFGGSRMLYVTACSYPCNGKARPDITFLARAIEEAGFDLRILLLTRPALQIVNKFNRERVAVLRRNCVQLKAQILSLAPEFWACAPYHYYSSEPHIERLSAFIGLNVSHAVHMTYRRSSRDDTAVLATADCETRVAFAKLDAPKDDDVPLRIMSQEHAAEEGLG
ncbi:hypothetical protein CTAYLR_002313 [Chrysophaeum taylorii]|uniref:Uncharacterized protein n=1 Tax=Chrysophaeum taylorii TaxID=2483200 RepID=A0AAD7XRJ5_9STRA|nr:hypothetical protein CTAYLR_002313 [Chrysophaeum taylorii]